MTGANEAYEESLLQALAAGLRERFDAARAAGRDPARFGEPAELAGRMLAAVPAANPWDDQIGPFYDTAGLTHWLGVTKQALADRVRRRRLLAVVTAEGRVLYPAAQFVGRRVLAGLPEALGAFRDTGVDGWAIAAWTTTPAAALRGSTPLRWLRDGGDAGPVLALARQTAALWAA